MGTGQDWRTKRIVEKFCNKEKCQPELLTQMCFLPIQLYFREVEVACETLATSFPCVLLAAEIKLS